MSFSLSIPCREREEEETTDDHLYSRLCSLEVDRSVLLEAFLVANWESRDVLRLPPNAKTVKDIDFARVNVPQMMNDCENGVVHDLTECGSSFYGNLSAVVPSEKETKKTKEASEEEEGTSTTTLTKPPPPKRSFVEKTKGDEGNKRGRNGITGDDIVSNEDEENNNDDSTRANIQHLREMIHKEHENKLDAEDEQKLDDSPLVKSMRELGVGSPTTATATASASPGGGEEDAGEGQAQRERQSEVSTTTATDNDVDQDKFQIMALLLKTALDDIVEPTFSAFSESDFAELALEVWLCRTPTWSDDAISEVIKALDIDETVGKTIANIAMKCQGYAPMESEQSARTHLMSMSLGNVHRATDVLCPEIDFFTSRSIAICEVLRKAKKREDENPINGKTNTCLAAGGENIQDDGEQKLISSSLVLQELTRFISESRGDERAFFTSQDDCEKILEDIEHALDKIDNESHNLKMSSAHPPSVAARAYYQLFKTALDPVEERSLAFDCEDTLNILKSTVRFGLGPSITEAAHSALFVLFLTKIATATNEDDDFETLDVDEEFEKRASILTRAGTELERALFCRTDDCDYTVVFKNDAIAGPTLMKLICWCEAAISDYIFDVSPPADFKETDHPLNTYDAEAFAAILRLYRYVMFALGQSDDNFEHALIKGSTSSAKKCYARIRKQAMENEVASENANDTLTNNPAAAAARVLEVVASEVSRIADEYAAHIAPRIKSCFFPSEYESFTAKSEIQRRQERADVVFPRELANLFVDEFTWWLESDPPLTTVSLRALWASGDAQAALSVCCDADALRRQQMTSNNHDGAAMVRATDADAEPNATSANDPYANFPKLNVKEKAAPLIFKWIGIKIDDANIFAQRAAQSEKWSNDRRYKNQPASSAVELLRLANETLEAFWGLGIPCSVSAIRALTEGIDGAFQRYASELLKDVEDTKTADELPEKPRLTRYKKDIVDKMQQDALENMKRYSWVPENAQSLDTASHSYCAKLSALDFILDELGRIECDLPNRWIRMQRDCVALANGLVDENIDGEYIQEGGNNQDDFEASKWLEDVFASARQTLASTIETFSNLLASRIVFTNMKEIFHDGAYVTKDKSLSRLSVVVVPALDDYMGAIVFSIGPRAAARLLEIVASAMLRKVCEMFVRITLDGGPGRAFDVADGRAFVLPDLGSIRETFEANGDGLRQEDVRMVMKEAEHVAATMASETDPLIKAIQNNEGANPTQQEIMFRVLCHRAEHSASKFLKTNAKLPKK